jgi:hypothetical protein
VPDLASPVVPTQCSPTDNLGDGTDCSAGCPAGTNGVALPAGGCKCYTSCTVDTECPCDRFCDVLSQGDAGVVGHACLPGNAPGQRCGSDSTGKVFGLGYCGQLTACVNADAAQQFRYCNYKCTLQSDCPQQTVCEPLMDNQGNTIGNVCAYNSGPNGNKDLGQACGANDVCKQGQLCDTVCRAQCDGPGATCATGSCTELDDPSDNRVIGYVCK